jgi:two-component system cell cycle response regulator
MKSDLKIERFQRYFNTLAHEDELLEFLRSTRIAVLDDSTLVLKTIRALFDLNRVQGVKYFTNPDDLLAEKDSFDFYLIDLVLPKMSGEEVIAHIRKTCPDAIVICISKINNERTLSSVLMAGADDYIMKPFSADVFISRLKINARSNMLMRALRRMALTDSLTGIYNHQYIHDCLEKEISRSRRYKKSLSIVMLDIDNFKLINDVMGHPKGDEILRAVTAAIKTCLRGSDSFGRYGGEEFLLVLPETDAAGALVVAEKIRDSLRKAKFESADLNVTVSGGVAELAEDKNAVELVSRADALLYVAKKQGKDRVLSVM